MMNIGAQFYTLRDFCTTTEDLAETLKKVADIGYRIVQISGTCAYDPQWLKTELDKNGLQCVLTHIPQDRLLADTVAVARDHDILGCDCVGLGCFAFDEEEGKRLEDFQSLFTPVAKKLAAKGKYFMYHNHAHEFIKKDGKVMLQHLAESFSPNELGFTLDTYWVQVGGGDPAWWIEHFSGRVPCIHLKDCAYGPKMAALGDGNINFDRVFEAAESAGTKYLLVEQDDCGGEDPFECLRRSYAFLKAEGFE